MRVSFKQKILCFTTYCYLLIPGFWAFILLCNGNVYTLIWTFICIYDFNVFLHLNNQLMCQCLLVQTNVICCASLLNLAYKCSMCPQAWPYTHSKWSLSRHDSHYGPPLCWSSFTGALIPVPYGQCVTKVARGDIGQNYKDFTTVPKSQ